MRRHGHGSSEFPSGGKGRYRERLQQNVVAVVSGGYVFDFPAAVSTDKIVVARLAENCIVAKSSIEVIITGAAGKVVITTSAKKLVVTISAEQGVATASTA